jgi:hypothetical protein
MSFGPGTGVEDPGARTETRHVPEADGDSSGHGPKRNAEPSRPPASPSGFRVMLVPFAVRAEVR